MRHLHYDCVCLVLIIFICFIIAIVIFIGHGSGPLSVSQMHPPSDKDTGRLIFLSREAKQLQQFTGNPVTGSKKMYDDLTDFQLTAGKTLFICQACYSGAIIEKMIKSIYSIVMCTAYTCIFL